MQDDATKEAGQSDKTDQAGDNIEELAPKPISDRDAQSIKGGRAYDDEAPKESKAKIG